MLAAYAICTRAPDSASSEDLGGVAAAPYGSRERTGADYGTRSFLEAWSLLLSLVA